MKQKHIGPSPFYFRKALTPPALGQVRVKSMDMADVEALLRSKVDLWYQLARDEAWEPLQDDVNDVYYEIGLRKNNGATTVEGWRNRRLQGDARTDARLRAMIEESVHNIIQNCRTFKWNEKSLTKSFDVEQALQMAEQGDWDVLRDYLFDAATESGKVDTIYTAENVARLYVANMQRCQDSPRTWREYLEWFQGHYVTKSLPDAEPAHRFACLMARPPLPVIEAVREWQKQHIDPDHLGPGGLETDIHCTVKFGWVSDDPETVDAVVRIMELEGPIPVTLKGFGVFSPNDDGDVLHVECESPRLRALNERFTKEFPCVDTHPDYKPHLTVAYLKPEYTDHYMRQTAPFLHQDVVFDTAVWSDRNRNHRVIVLGLRGQEPKALGGLAKGMDYQDAERYLRSKEPLFAQLAADDQWDILHDAVLEALEEVGYHPDLRSSEAKVYVYWLRQRVQQYGGGMSQLLADVSRRVAATVSTMRLHQSTGDKDLSWLNASAGGALVKPPKQPRRLVKSFDHATALEIARSNDVGVLADYLKENSSASDFACDYTANYVCRCCQHGYEGIAVSELEWFKNQYGNKSLPVQTKSLPDQRMIAEFIRQGDLGPLADYLQDMGYDTDEAKVRQAVDEARDYVNNWGATQVNRLKPGDVIDFEWSAYGGPMTVVTIRHVGGQVELTTSEWGDPRLFPVNYTVYIQEPGTIGDVIRNFLMRAGNWKTKNLSVQVKSMPDQRLVAQFIQQGDLGPLSDYLQDQGYDTDENRVRIVVTDLREDLEHWEPVRVDRLKDGDVFMFYSTGGGEQTVRNLVRVNGPGNNWTIETDHHIFQSVAGNESVTRITAPTPNDMARHLLIYANGHWRTKSLAPSLRGRKALTPPTLVDGKCRPNL